jgi:AcrR family transcriptional regulator
MHAAMGLAAEDGMARATTARIAARAGIAEGTIYRHFATKDLLLIEVYLQIKREVFEFVRASYDPEASLSARFSHLWRQTFFAYRQEKECLLFAQKFSESELVVEDGAEAHKVMSGLLLRLHKDGMAENVFKDLPFDLLKALFYAPIIAMLQAEVSGHIWQSTEIDNAEQATLDSWRIHTETK